MNSPKTYRLARKLKVQTGLNSIEKNNKRILLSSSRDRINIFDDNQELRKRGLELQESSIEYKVIGAQEIDIYKKTKERRKKDLRSNDDDKATNILTERVSQIPISNNLFLSKEEVLNLFSLNKPLKTNKSQEYLISNVQTVQNHTDRSFITSIKPQSDFSLLKLKQKMLKYNKYWKKYRQKQPNMPLLLKKKYRKQQQYNLQNNNQKKNVHLLLKKELKHENIVPWSLSLRKNHNHSNLQKEGYCEKILKNSLCSVGKNKLQKQRQWIEQKYKEGFYFEKTKRKMQN